MKKGVLITIVLVLFLAYTVRAADIHNFTHEDRHLMEDGVNTVFVYDITKDSTNYTTWYDNSSKNWYNHFVSIQGDAGASDSTLNDYNGGTYTTDKLNFTLEFSETKTISGFGLYWYDCNYDCADSTIEASTDNITWTIINTSCGEICEGRQSWYNITETDLKYIRWNCTSYNDNFPRIRQAYVGEKVEGNFPLKSYLIGTDYGLDIIDASDNSLWMRLPHTVTNAGVHYPEKIYAGEGKIMSSTYSSYFIEIDFILDDILCLTNNKNPGSYKKNGRSLTNPAQSTNGAFYTLGNDHGYTYKASGNNPQEAHIRQLDDGKTYVATVSKRDVHNLVNFFIQEDNVDYSYGLGDSISARVYLHSNGDLIFSNSTNLMRELDITGVGGDFTPDNITEISDIQDIVVNDDFIFVGNASGVYQINSSNFTLTGVTYTTSGGQIAGTSDDVRELDISDNGNTLYIGTYGGGVTELNIASETITHSWDDVELLSNHITSLDANTYAHYTEDYLTSGTLLVGTDSGANAIDWSGGACSVPGDIIANEVINFKNDSVPFDIDVTVNVYSKDASGNPYPVDGHNSFCHRITAVRSGNAKKLALYPKGSIYNVNYISITGANDPVSYGNVYWDFRPTNNVAVGETSAALYYTSSDPVGTIPYELLDDLLERGGGGAVPEFSTIGIILAITISLFFLLYIRKNSNKGIKMKKQKKAQLKEYIVFILVAIIVVGAMALMWKYAASPEPIQTYAVKEIQPDGSVIEKQVPADSPSMTIKIEAGSGEQEGVVPLESNKNFRVE